MIYNYFKDVNLSRLGFGTMRLPTLENGEIDEAKVFDMVDYALENGINYFDTAYPYHGGKSEIVIGKALARYPRDKYFLATKYPGHQFADEYNPAKIFEDQLKKCGVEYFDFYLLHNVYEKSMEVYTDPKWGIIDYFVEQKRFGRIKHLGFSSHGGLDNLKEFVERYEEHMEFCQIEMNYLDWTLQGAKEKYELLMSKDIPVWIMEPVRGGKLAKLSEKNEEKLLSLRPDESIASWAFNWLIRFDGVKMILSGMSDMEQMRDNVKTFETGSALSDYESEVVLGIAEDMKNSVPCTACRYCVDGCPQRIDIPEMLSIYNELRTAPSMNARMRVDSLPEDRRPSACIACGKCSDTCPQKIDIPNEFKKMCEELNKLPSWEEICRQRAEAEKALNK